MGNTLCFEKRSTAVTLNECSFNNYTEHNDNRIQIETTSFVTISVNGQVKTLGNYVLGEKLGIGSYGVVYMANHPSHNNKFAIKCVNKQKVTMSGHRKSLEHLITEIEVMSTIKSDNIIRLYDIYQDQTNYYLIIDYCNQGDFASYISSIGQNYLEEAEAIYFLKQIKDAFVVLRNNLVMHRDIKLENMFVHDHKLKLGDFGFAKIRQDTTSSVLGSKYTMAPEIVSGISKTTFYGPKCDLWSVGCVFYEMLFGSKLIIGNEGDGSIKAIAKAFESFKDKDLKLPRPISPLIEDILRRMLTKNVNDRIDFDDFFNHPIFKMSCSEVRAIKDNLQKKYGCFRSKTF